MTAAPTPRPGPSEAAAAPAEPVAPTRAAATPIYGPHVGGGVPHELYSDLRARYGPLAPVSIADGVEAWLVIGWNELRQVATNEADFSHDPRHWNLLREGRIPPDSPLMPFVGWRPAVLFADGRQHRRIRAAVSDALKAIDGHDLRRLVRELAERLIAEFAGAGEADLVAQFARMLPRQVIAALAGLDEDTGRRFTQAISATALTNEASQQANAETARILAALIADKRENPADDVISALLQHPAALSDEEVLHNLTVLFVAGNQATVAWIATTLHVMLCDPAWRFSLTRGSVSLDNALGQVLWQQAPVQNFPARYATRDLEFGGQPVRAGDMIILGLAGANADPAVQPPDGQPVTGNRSWVSFGAGPHVCPAQDPAWLITRTAIDTLCHRLPDVELTMPEEELPWIPSTWSKAPAALPVRFSAARPAAPAPPPAADRPSLPATRRTAP
ncbi:cytochrome P450 [Streptomyces sp. NPDC059740]|uniref:cytochrome P450 n=1 Tax=Streptomyces sp. NPDC059740 TaxID=3346926 RepID=UPI003669BC3D